MRGPDVRTWRRPRLLRGLGALGMVALLASINATAADRMVLTEMITMDS